MRSQQPLGQERGAQGLQAVKSGVGGQGSLEGVGKILVSKYGQLWWASGSSTIKLSWSQTQGWSRLIVTSFLAALGREIHLSRSWCELLYSHLGAS
eukprot:1151959-Pelagomonas_calceolata.AAC.2